MKNKEQTPIEWLLSKINVDESSWEEIEKYESIAKQKEQKHIQAKVLEALEREVKKCGEVMREKGFNDCIISLNSDGKISFSRSEEAINYFETEVKPKYE